MTGPRDASGKTVWLTVGSAKPAPSSALTRSRISGIRAYVVAPGHEVLPASRCPLTTSKDTSRPAAYFEVPPPADRSVAVPCGSR